MEQHAVVTSAARRRAVSDPQSLILMFSPPTTPVRVDPNVSPGDRRALWAADAVHRAKNLAQLAAAMAHIRLRAFDSLELDEMGRNAQALAAAYAELAEELDGPENVPCANLLARIVRGLVGTFGSGARTIALKGSVAELWLSREHRRALALIASELVINALKYAFRDKGGTIAVSLTVDSRHALFTVEDDGGGLGIGAKPGNGSRIMDELAVVLRAPVDRIDLPKGGLRVSVSLPLTPQAGCLGVRASA